MANIALVDLDLGPRRGWSYVDVALYLVGVAGLSASLTILWLGMRAVLGVGGFCAEGGPYTIAVHCPEGTAFLLPLAIFAGLGCAGLMGWKGSQLGSPWGALVGLAWPALFISLGWNFLEFAIFPPGDGGGIELGWLIPGVLFVIMGAVPLIGFMPGGKSWKSDASDGAAPRYDFAADSEERYADELRHQRSQLLSDLVQSAQQRSSGPSSSSPLPSDDADLVSKLERLSALYRAGSLSYDEFQRAKAALIAEAGG